MARWTIVALDNAIGKDGTFYHDLDLSWLPSDVLAVQSYDGVTCEIETGDKVLEKVTGNQENVAVSGLSWWLNVDTTWQAADDANGE
jgi:hypothetical protein